MITREAVILAGGFGTRLNTVVADRPKPMAEINGRPFLEYLLDFLIRQGIDKIILSVGYRHEMIIRHFGDSYKNAILSYAVESTPLGTGGGIRNALPMVHSDRTFIVNGDTFFNIPLTALEDKFVGKKADMMLALHPVSDPDRYGTVLTGTGGRILRFLEKSDSEASALINGGVYLMKKNIFSGFDLPSSFSFEKEFLEKHTSALRIYGIPFQNAFIDIGIPETYRDAADFFGNEEIAK